MIWPGTSSRGRSAADWASDLRLTPEAFASFSKEGASFSVSIPLRNYPKSVKAVLYNFNSDLLGTTSAMVY